MKRFVTIVALLGSLLFLALCGCVFDEPDALAPASSDAPASSPVALDPATFPRGPLFSYAGLSGLFLDEDGELLIVLRGSASAGDEWTYTVEPGGVLRQTTSAYASDVPPATGEGVGQGYYYWVFEGVEAGDARIAFSYTGSESESGEAEPLVYRVSVGADGRISFFKRLIPRPS